MKVLNQNANLKEKYYIYSLSRQSDTAFYSFFNGGDYINQRLDMMAVMEYDSVIKKLEKDIKEALIIKRGFFSYLCQDNINLEQVRYLFK